jgi:hypothetical protein
MTFIVLIVYSVAIWQISSYASVEAVSMAWGGGFAPHALRAVRSIAFGPVTIIWYLLCIGMELSPRFFTAYEWMHIFPGIGTGIISYFLIGSFFVIKQCSDRAVQEAISQIETPPVAYEESDYPTSLVSQMDHSKLLPLMKDPQIGAQLVDTPFRATKEMPASLVGKARKIVPGLWVQPLHPMIGKSLADQINHLTETTHQQADKALVSVKQAQQAQQQLQKLETEIEELRKNNETLNSKLLSLRSRSRGSAPEPNQT